MLTIRRQHVLIACLWALTVVVVTACGGGGGSSPPPSDPNHVGAGWIDITSPTSDATYTTTANQVSVSGAAFISPILFSCCTGSATDTGVTVTWSSATTGQTGPARQTAQYCGIFNPVDYLCGHTWSASISLVPGANVISVTASDGKNIGRASINVTSTYNVTPPLVKATSPANGATIGPINASLTSTFDKPIDATTITSATFLLRNGSGTPVSGAVSYANNVATFVPSTALGIFTTYTATITTAVADTFGNHLAASYVWSFTTGSATVSAPHFAYIANYGDNTISEYTVDATTGQLTLTGSATTGTGPNSLALAAPENFLYVANDVSSDIYAYAINTGTGALSSIGTRSGSPNWSQPTAITVDRLGKFLYLVSTGTNALAVYAINAVTGTLSIVNSSIALSPSAVTLHPSGRFAYVTFSGTNGNSVSSFAVDATTGTLTFVGTATTGSTPSSITVDPSGKFAYVTNSLSNNVSVYSVDQTSGLLTGVGAPVAAGSHPNEVVVEPLGKFAYVVNSTSHNVSVYAIDQSTGMLSSVGTPVDAGTFGTFPTAIAVDPSGHFVYVTNGGVLVYTINSSTGMLTSAGAPVGTGSFPSEIAIQ